MQPLQRKVRGVSASAIIALMLVAASISIRATSANLGGSKALGDLEWRRSDLAAWNTIGSTDTQVEQKVMIRGLLNDPWGNTVFFRMKLSWTVDPPATYSANYQVTLSQTVP